MPRAEYLVPLPSMFANAITAAVREFAEKTGLQAEFWVHDLPLWIVSSIDANTGIVRRLQVGAYRLEASEELRIVPQVFRLDSDRRSLIAFEEIDPTLIRHMTLWAVQTQKEVKELLAQAWADVQRMSPPEASSNQRTRTISIPVSPNYGR